MDDLRQGVTPTQHEVLDLIEECAPGWSARMDFEDKLREARGSAADATRHKTLAAKRFAAIAGAALLIDAADEMGRLMSATPH